MSNQLLQLFVALPKVQAREDEVFNDAGEKGTSEDEMVEWHQRLNGYEFEQALGVSEEQRSLACCSPRGHKELDMTKQLN